MRRPVGLFGHEWTPAEVKRLRAAYLQGGLPAARKALPDRSDSALCKRVKILGLTVKREWTYQEDRSLRDIWGHVTQKEVAHQLRRSEGAVNARAKKLRLGIGCPQGLEYLGEAAKRTGFAHAQVKRILRWAGVRMMRSFSRHRVQDPVLRRVVDPFDVDQAIKRWLSTEPVAAAARRHQISASTLRVWLTQSGVDMSHRTSSGRRAHARIDSDVIDRVVREQMSRPSCRANGAEKRHGKDDKADGKLGAGEHAGGADDDGRTVLPHEGDAIGRLGVAAE